MKTSLHVTHEYEHHTHTAPHGGALIEVGEHQYNLELVLDRATGTHTFTHLTAKL